MQPDFVVIGAQKAGSTYVLRCLEEHPAIFMPPYEVAFFDDGLYSPEKLGQFQAHFKSAKNGQLVGFKRPNLLGLPECPRRLYENLPNAKLIVILRNPIARAVSAYFHYMKTGFLPIVPFEVGMRKILDGEYVKYPRAKEVLTFGLYERHLREYLHYYHPEQLKVVYLEAVSNDAQVTIQQLYAFLGVDTKFQPSARSGRPMAASYSLTRLSLWNGIDRWLRKDLHGGKFFERRTDPLSRIINRANVAIDRYLWSRMFSQGPPKLSGELHQRLVAYYQEDVNRLQASEQWQNIDWNDFHGSRN